MARAMTTGGFMLRILATSPAMSLMRAAGKSVPELFCMVIQPMRSTCSDAAVEEDSGATTL